MESFGICLPPGASVRPHWNGAGLGIDNPVIRSGYVVDFSFDQAVPLGHGMTVVIDSLLFTSPPGIEGRQAGHRVRLQRGLRQPLRHQSPGASAGLHQLDPSIAMGQTTPGTA